MKMENYDYVSHPYKAWTVCEPEELSTLLGENNWTLVEFWSPDIIFGRLMLPHRVFFSTHNPYKLKLALCKFDKWDSEIIKKVDGINITSLPAIVLFNKNKTIKTWYGIVETMVILYDIDNIMKK